jgi:autotransporter adhesin
MNPNCIIPAPEFFRFCLTFVRKEIYIALSGMVAAMLQEASEIPRNPDVPTVIMFFPFRRILNLYHYFTPKPQRKGENEMKKILMILMLMIGCVFFAASVVIGDERIQNVADGIEPTDAVNVRQLDKVKRKVDAQSSAISQNRIRIVDLEGRMGGTEAEIDDLGNRVTDTEGDVVLLKEDVDNLAGGLDDLSDRVDGAEAGISDLDVRVSENETEMAGVKDRVSETETKIVEIGDRVTINETDIDDLEAHSRGLSWTPANDPAVGASATGLGSTAVGDGATARNFDTAVGYNATVTADNSVAVGANSRVDSADSVAIGADASVSAGADGGTAIGQNARVAAGATGSVAIGKDSVADQAGTISVGSSEFQRRITNIANGVDAGDAVNMYQLQETRLSFQNQLDQVSTDLNRRISNVDRRVDDVGAMAAAFSAMVPDPRGSSGTQASFGLGVYEDSTALSAGLFHFFDECVLLNVGVSHGFRENQTAGRAGMTIHW